MLIRLIVEDADRRVTTERMLDDSTPVDESVASVVPMAQAAFASRIEAILEDAHTARTH